jgi:hypothetical protein
MGWMMLIFVGIIAVFTWLMYWANRWASRYVQKFLEERLDALREITEEGKVPAAWSAPYQARIARQQPGGSAAQIAHTQARARRHCLRQLDELIKYVQGVRFEDTQNTQRFLLEKLREQKSRWETATWEAMMEMHVSEEESLAN